MNRNINNKNKSAQRPQGTNPKVNKAALLGKRNNKKQVKKKDKSEGSIAKKILSVTASVFLTLFLIGFITGTIVVGAFAIYIKNYIDPVIDDFDMISTEQKQSSRI